jgi:beta-lactam-binding protein with PASTA domain
MKKRAAGTVGAVSLLIAGTLGLAAPAAAASSWEMPDVEGMILQEAWDEIVSTTDGAVTPETTAADGTPYEQINLTNWVVCEQSPSEGDEFSAEEPPELEVARLNGC